MTFEEDFPSLKGKTGHLSCNGEHVNCVGGESRDYIVVPLIKEFCLDKQKVKDAITKALRKTYRADIEDVLMKELNLL